MSSTSIKISVLVLHALEQFFVFVESQLFTRVLKNTWYKARLRSRSLGRTESEIFGWSRSRTPNNTRSRCRSWIFCPTPEVQSDHFLHHTLSWEFVLKWYNFFWNLCWKRFLAVQQDFHWLLIAAKLFTAKLHFLYVKEWGVGVGNFGKGWSRSWEPEILERSESGFGNFGKFGVRYFTSDSASLWKVQCSGLCVVKSQTGVTVWPRYFVVDSYGEVDSLTRLG